MGRGSAPTYCAGCDLNFGPVRVVCCSHGGAFYIRRIFLTVKNYIQRCLVYLDVLLGTGLSVEFFLEVGKSHRTVTAAKRGML